MQTPDAPPAITLHVTEQGRAWTAEELARIAVAPDEVPDDFAPLESAQAQLEALGYRVVAIAGLGLTVMATVEPDLTCDWHPDHDVERDVPTGPRCGSAATHRIVWLDGSGRVSLACADHLVLDPTAPPHTVCVGARHLKGA